MLYRTIYVINRQISDNYHNAISYVFFLFQDYRKDCACHQHNDSFIHNVTYT